MRTPERTNKKKQRITLLGVIANGSTGNARRLLKKYDMPNAVNHQDLEMKLSKLYAQTDDKIKLEKELAEMHPHKEFILNNLTPKPAEPEIVISEVEAKTKDMATENNNAISSCNCPICSGTSNACGCSHFGGTSNACGSCSGIDGSGSNNPQNANTINSGLMVLGIVGIISIFALALKR